jgi:hypothetical protein
VGLIDTQSKTRLLFPEMILQDVVHGGL